MFDATASQSLANTLINQASGTSMGNKITQAIKVASARTGVDFSYLLNKASQESGFDPNAKASTSSATGLFQFVEQTWLRMVKNYGAEFGLGDYADKIQIDSSGVAHVSDSKTKHAILAMRKDPQLSANMAAELDNENKDTLKAKVGGKIGATELYLAHFLGAGGASEFLKKMRSNPGAKAADILPDAAEANSSVFYNKTGEAKTLSQIYNHFAKKFQGTPDMPDDSTMVADTVKSYSSYRMASMPSGAASKYTPSVMSSIKSDSSSYFAAMILSQMDTHDITRMSAYGKDEEKDASRKNKVISDLASLG